MFHCGKFATEIYFVFVLSMCHQCVQINAVLSLTEYVYEACYGITFDDFLQPRCNATDVLYIRDVLTYAKPTSWNCPQLSTSLDRNDQLCCRYMNNSVDCGWRYYSDSLSTHYTNCVGRQTCQVQVSWNETSGNCDQSYFMDKTNYMREYFHCISSSSISDICTTSTKTGTLLYIWSDGYPSTGSDCSTSSGCLCSVTGKSQIQIGILDIRFQYDSSCHQSLHITDGSSQYIIHCSHKNDFSFSAVYTSQTTSISIRFDNTHATNGGHFWVSVQATEISSSLTMTCGTGTPVYSCGDVITTTTASTISSSLSSASSDDESTIADDTTIADETTINDETTIGDETVTTVTTTTETTESTAESTSTISTTESTTTTLVDELSTSSESTVTTATTSSSTTVTTESSSDNNLSNSSSTETSNNSGSLSSDDKTWMIVGAAGGAALLLFVFVIACLMRYWCKRRTRIQRITPRPKTRIQRITPRPEEKCEENRRPIRKVKNVPRNVPPIGHKRVK